MIKNISDVDIVKLNIPTGVPYVFELSSQFKIIKDYYLGEEGVSIMPNMVPNQTLSES